MNPKDIRTSSDPDLAGSFAAMERAASKAQDLAIKTNTGIESVIRHGLESTRQIAGLAAGHICKRRDGL